MCKYEEGGTPNLQLNPFKIPKRVKYHHDVIKKTVHALSKYYVHVMTQ